MEAATVIEISKEALLVLCKLSLPLLLVALIVGFSVSLLQALTQIQEPSLAFIPKIIAIFMTMFIMLPYIGGVMSNFSETLSSLIIKLE